MKIIVSHDVDHLYRNDHYKDLIYPKLWIRSTLEVIKKDIDTKEWLYRMQSPFQKVRHHIPEVLEFDKKNKVKSSFFFGMRQGLGMSYKKDKVLEPLRFVADAGFDVGVHGIIYDDLKLMKDEYESFHELSGFSANGIRMHYVRFDNSTFKKLSSIGYAFDTTEFDKQKGYLIKAPYKINQLWEFPLTIMDGYLPPRLDEMKDKTIDIVKLAEKYHLPYFTLLFHDYLFSDAYHTSREWYKWVIKWFNNNNYEFISYMDAIAELEEQRVNNE